jgi:CheY-like chemotaxis protein
MQKTMLIVDDSRVSRMMIRSFSAALQPDWRFIEAVSGEEAIEIAGREMIDLISMDMNMEGMSGMDAAEKIMSMQSSVFIVILSANVQAVNRSKADALGLNFVAKPVTPATVETIFALYGASHA